MKNLVFFLFVVLILWISGASYWYVCRIRGDCKDSPIVTENAPSGTSEPTGTSAALTEAETLRAALEEARTYLVAAGSQKVYFETSSSSTDMAVVPAEYVSKLKLLLSNTPEAIVSVTGHTDNTGSKAFNEKLGAARADFVKSYLANSGIKPEQIVTSSKDFSEPAAPNDNPEGRAKNRRTEIKF
jgi:outer membrane protein OmpA-like peptidoglycan-associated protein